MCVCVCVCVSICVFMGCVLALLGVLVKGDTGVGRGQ